MCLSASEFEIAYRVCFSLQPVDAAVNELLIECEVTVNSFEVRSAENDTMTNPTVHCSGALAVSHGWLHVDHALVRNHSCVRVADVGALYESYDRIGMQYILALNL